MLIASASGNQTIAPSSSVKLRKSRRLSSTRGLKQRATANPSKNPPPCHDLDRKLGSATSKNTGENNGANLLSMNWEMNERISLSSGSSAGLAVRPDLRRGIEFSDNRRKMIDGKWKFGECSGQNRDAKPSSLLSSSTKPTLELMNVSGFPPSVDHKHRGNRSPEIDDENILKSDAKYEIGVPSHEVVTKKQRRRDSLGKGSATDSTRSRAKNKPDKDSISKRLELIRELNQKILSNYEKFQQRSKRAKNAREQSSVKSRARDNAGECVYAEIEKKSRETKKTNDRKDRRSVPGQDASGDRDTREKVSSKQENSKQSVGKFFKSREKIGARDRTWESGKSSRTIASKSDRRVVCENTNFSMAVKDDFGRRVDDETRSSVYAKARDRGGRLSEGSTIFYTDEDLSSRETASASTEDCLENSRLYPESCNPANDEPKKEETAVGGDDRYDPREDAGTSSTARGDVLLDEKILECKILEKLDETIDRFDSEPTQLTSADSNSGEEEEEKDSFSTDSIQSCSPSSAKGSKDANLPPDTFNSSWDSGVGVDVGNGSGWVRIHTGIESSLVYLTLDTTAKDVCRDMLLGDELSLFVQVNGSATDCPYNSRPIRHRELVS